MRVLEWLKHEWGNVRAWMTLHPFLVFIFGALIFASVLSYLVMRWLTRSMREAREDIFNRQERITEASVLHAVQRAIEPPATEDTADEDEDEDEEETFDSTQDAWRPQDTRNTRRRASRKKMPQKTGPTAWDRILAVGDDEDEEVKPCPPTKTPEAAENPPAPPKKKRAPRKKA